MKTFYAWAIVDDVDQLDQVEFMTDADGEELRFTSESDALAYITDDVINDLIGEGIDPNDIVLTAYELECH